jgi:glycosyltransferase involved in cell wall biosynthesis
MATGLPCVASDIGGNQDLLGTGGAGVLLPPGEPGRWAVTLVDLLRNPERRRALGQAARRRVLEEFALERVVARYVALYRRLLETKQARRAGRA